MIGAFRAASVWRVEQMKNTFNEYIQAANNDGAQKVIDELCEHALKDNPEITAEQWQILKCLILAGAIEILENN